jgi:hypothetical protein
MNSQGSIFSCRQGVSFRLPLTDFPRVHRMGLIACSYRAAEWRHKEIELTAVELLQYLDTKSERVGKR